MPASYPRGARSASINRLEPSSPNNRLEIADAVEREEEFLCRESKRSVVLWRIGDPAMAIKYTARSALAVLPSPFLFSPRHRTATRTGRYAAISGGSAGFPPFSLAAATQRGSQSAAVFTGTASLNFPADRNDLGCTAMRSSWRTRLWTRNVYATASPSKRFQLNQSAPAF